MNTINKIQVNDIIYNVEDANAKIQNILYADLKALRDNSQLVPGKQYRITDYQCTTVESTTAESNTKVANNQFDIIVTAESENILSHLAKATLHEGDTYFASCDLKAWQLWYDVDNDINKYAWADNTNGKGVIYRMIDDKNNDCPYDFKNIMFYTTKYTSNTTSDKYYYTFSYVVSGKLYDGTVESQIKYCYGNSMGEYLISGKQRLNNIIFNNKSFTNNCHCNTFENNCYSNTFGNNCYSNTFGNDCCSNTFVNYCSYNTFGNNCYSNTFGNYCGNNTFGNNCNYNTFGNECDDLKIDNNKTSITLNDEYYNDGSGQLVPIKHPDLSTQPSILPYKFMGQYVYEQLVMTNIDQRSTSSCVNVCWPSSLEKNKMYLDIKALLQFNDGTTIAIPILSYNGDYILLDGNNIYNIDKSQHIYLHVVYTSIPEEGDYYGYNNY